jgi:flavin-dependent dehydrogenase
MDDVIVCGAGPAGSIAALLLARAGVRVRLFDRARFPRDKLCGDTLNPGALAILRRLGLEFAAAGGLPIRGMVVTGEPAVRVEGPYGDGMFGTSLLRRELDFALLEAAIAAGVNVEECVLVRDPIVEDGVVRGVSIAGAHGRSLSVRAPLVIAADGGRSRLARALGLACHPAHPRRWAIGAYFEDVAGMSDCGEMHVRSDGYIGVAPLRGGLGNACVVTANRQALADPINLLERTLHRDPVLAERFAHSRRVTPPSCLGPLAVESSACGVPGLLLAGDAAGFIDPMTGDGLRFAFRGAELAAAESIRALEHGYADAHLRLAAARRRDFKAKWRFNRALRALVGSPVCVRVAAHGASWAPGILQHAIRYAGDLRIA